MGQLVFQAALGGAVNLIGPNISATTNFTLPGADGTNGQALTTNGSGVLGFSSIVSGSAGSNTQVQFNSGGNFGASASLTWDGTNLTSTGFSGPHNGTVGATTPNTGSFTTLAASSTVSGTGFSTYLASPPAIGSTAANTGSFTTLTTSSTVTLNGGTANGVTYLNGSKVLTSGSALTFDGTTFAQTGANGIPIRLQELSSAPTSQTAAYIGVSTSAFPGGNNGDLVLVPRTSSGNLIRFYTGNGTSVERYSIDSVGVSTWSVSGSQAMTLTSTGLGIGTSSPNCKFEVKGGSAITTLGNSYTNAGMLHQYSSSILLAIGSDGTNPVMQGVNATNNTAKDLVLQPLGGNLGLGVTPSAWSTSGFKALQISSTSISNNGSNDSFFGANYYFDGTNNRYINTDFASAYGQVDGTHRWYTAASGTAGTVATLSQNMTLDASGNLGIGTTSPANLLHVNGSNSVARFSGTSTALSAYQTFFNNSAAQAYFGIESSSGTGIIGTGAAYGMVLSTASTNPLCFGTNGTERARIDSSGNLLVGTTSTGYSNTSSTNSEASAGRFIANHITGASSGSIYVGFAYAGSGIGSITQSGTTAVLYNVTSDQRLKENIQDADSASSLIDSLQVRKFDWKADGNHQRYGFVAQELVTVAPEAVHQPVDTEEMMAVDYSKLVPMLVKEIQSLRQRVAQLETN